MQILKKSELVDRHGIFNGERCRILKLEVGQGVIGVPVAAGPRLLLDDQEGGGVVVDTVFIRHASYDDGTPEPCDAVALIIGIRCAQEVERMVAMAGEKLRLVGAGGQVRVSRVEIGWQVSGLLRAGGMVGRAAGEKRGSGRGSRSATGRRKGEGCARRG